MIINQNLQNIFRLRRILKENPSNFVECVLTNFPSKTSPEQNFKNRNLAVEYSSPNIAKPFHVGHLRSTFIGRFISNFLQLNGAKVTRINYLGDWGTQFGILAAGFEKFGDEKLLKTEKIKYLNEIYVKANQEVEKNPAFAKRTLAIFAQLESAEGGPLEFWKRCRDMSIEDFSAFYKRLNVDFDVWQYESMFADQARKLVDDYLLKNIFVRLENGLIGAKTDPLPNSEKEFHFIPMAKSDSSSFYLSRDVVAAIERVDKMNFDHIYYVVDVGQEHHFNNLKLILKHIGREDVASKISHIKFGLIRHMSTRKGNVVLVYDMLTQGENIAKNLLKNSPTTKIFEEEFDTVAPNLAITSFLINDLKQKRTKGYQYDWETILKATGDNGYLLHLCHARLSSLEEKCRDIIPKFDSLENFPLADVLEPEGLELISHLTEKLSKTLVRCSNDFESSRLVEFLFQLCHLSNVAHKKLRVLESSEDVRNSRLLLFSTTKLLLARCMNILGVNAFSKL